jgi:hypothetical protein
VVRAVAAPSCVPHVALANQARGTGRRRRR